MEPSQQSRKVSPSDVLSRHAMKMSAMNNKIIQAQAEKLSKKLKHFNKAETKCLIREFYALVGKQGNPVTGTKGLDRGKFREILHDMFDITDDLMMDGVFRVFDKDVDGFISLEEWLEGLSVFLRGTLEEKIRHCYRVYDLNNDKSISREEMFILLQGCIIRPSAEEDPNDAVKELVEIVMKKMDDDHNGFVSLEEYENVVLKENLWLETLGTCLPDETTVEKYERRVFQEQE